MSRKEAATGGEGEVSSQQEAKQEQEQELEVEVEVEGRLRSRPRPRRDDFWSKEYWEERFSLQPSPLAGHTLGIRGGGQDQEGREGEREAFEWLGAGEELLTRLVAGLEEVASRKTAGGPRVLHIGCGSSDVGCRLRNAWESHSGWNLERIVNLDYAPSSLELTRQQELERFGNVQMRHVVADLLSLSSLLAILPQAATSASAPQSGTPVGGQLVDGTFDKSTADAISTGPDIVLLPSSEGSLADGSSARNSFLSGWTTRAASPEEEEAEINAHRRARRKRPGPRRDPNEVVLEPVELLAYNLAAVTRPGGIWAALSYSATRFAFLEEEGTRSLSESVNGKENAMMPMSLRDLWEVESKWSVEAPGDGQVKKDVYAPEVRHWCFLLRRTHVSLQSR